MKQSLFKFGVVLGLVTLPWISVSADSHQLPPVPFEFSLGYSGFNQYCAVCHGETLAGSKQRPPLMHGYHHPSYHSDVAFYRAISRGVQQHHWEFGDMPAVIGIQENEAVAIVRFIRWAQQTMELY